MKINNIGITIINANDHFKWLIKGWVSKNQLYSQLSERLFVMKNHQMILPALGEAGV